MLILRIVSSAHRTAPRPVIMLVDDEHDPDTHSSSRTTTRRTISSSGCDLFAGSNATMEAFLPFLKCELLAQRN